MVVRKDDRHTNNQQLQDTWTRGWTNVKDRATISTPELRPETSGKSHAAQGPGRGHLLPGLKPSPESVGGALHPYTAPMWGF